MKIKTLVTGFILCMILGGCSQKEDKKEIEKEKAVETTTIPYNDKDYVDDLSDELDILEDEDDLDQDEDFEDDQIQEADDEKDYSDKKNPEKTDNEDGEGKESTNPNKKKVKFNN